MIMVISLFNSLFGIRYGLASVLTVLELAISFVITYQSDILSLLVVIILYFTQAINNVEYGGSLVTTVHHTMPYIVDTTAPLLQIIMVEPYDTVANTLTVHYMAK